MLVYISNLLFISKIVPVGVRLNLTPMGRDQLGPYHPLAYNFFIHPILIEDKDWVLKKRPRIKHVTSSPLARNHPLAHCSGGNQAMGIKDEFLGRPSVKVLVTLWCLLNIVAY